MSNVPKYMNRVAGWQITTTAVEANATDLQHIEPQRVELDQIHEDFMGLSTQQSVLTARKQDTTRRVQEMFRRGETLVDLIRTAVRQYYGKDSEKLIEFGLQPFRGRNRTAPTSPPPPPLEAPAPVASISAPDTTK
ncbi:MAG TPA: hypothetical protein VN493_10370 [Thermoanaerobaculia bacterium]|nr:hypothetical protein [Thermoanaerobaculia bacterium]